MSLGSIMYTDTKASGKIIGLDHIAITGDNPEKTQNFFAKHLGITFGDKEFIKQEDLFVSSGEIGEGTCGDKSSVEILFPDSNNKSIQKFIKNKKGAVHHIALRVDNLDMLLSKLISSGVCLLNSKPNIGKGGSRLSLIHI